MRILSLGAGVQSTTLLLMSIEGALPPLDVVIFADTGWEPPSVYRHLEWLTCKAASHGIEIRRASRGNLRDDCLRRAKSDARRCASIGYFTLSESGRKGKMPRQCTTEYKIRVVRSEIRRVCGYGPHSPMPVGFAELWLGISIDEATRVTMSNVQYLEHRFPLIDPLDFSRDDCLEWIIRHGYPEPPRSACVGCPFRSNSEWRHLQGNEPRAWAAAVAFDAAIRRQPGMVDETFVHRQCVPLGEADLSLGSDPAETSEKCVICMT